MTEKEAAPVRPPAGQTGKILVDEWIPYDGAPLGRCAPCVNHTKTVPDRQFHRGGAVPPHEAVRARRHRQRWNHRARGDHGKGFPKDHWKRLKGKPHGAWVRQTATTTSHHANAKCALKIAGRRTAVAPHAWRCPVAAQPFLRSHPCDTEKAHRSGRLFLIFPTDRAPIKATAPR